MQGTEKEQISVLVKNRFIFMQDNKTKSYNLYCIYTSILSILFIK